MKRMLLVLLLLPACQSTDSRNNRVVRFVDEITFGGAYDAHLPHDNTITRWSGDIRVQVSGLKTDELDSLVLRRLQVFSQVVGLPSERVDKFETPNLTVTFVADLDFVVNRERAPCYAQIPNRTNFDIVQAEIYISVVEPDIIEHCIDHELMHVFGFRYHSGLLRSTLSPFHEAEGLTVWDQIALSVLFDPRIEPGTKRGQVFPTVQKIVHERLRAQ